MKQTEVSGHVPEFMHEVVAERERRSGQRPDMSFMDRIARDLERHYQRLAQLEAQTDSLVNIDGSVYVRQSSADGLTDMLRENLSRHAQWFDSNPDVNSADHPHRWVLDYITGPDRFLSLHHYTCADCGRQIQASIAGG